VGARRGGVDASYGARGVVGVWDRGDGGAVGVGDQGGDSSHALAGAHGDGDAVEPVVAGGQDGSGGGDGDLLPGGQVDGCAGRIGTCEAVAVGVVDDRLGPVGGTGGGAAGGDGAQASGLVPVQLMGGSVGQRPAGLVALPRRRCTRRSERRWTRRLWSSW